MRTGENEGTAGYDKSACGDPARLVGSDPTAQISDRYEKYHGSHVERSRHEAALIRRHFETSLNRRNEKMYHTVNDRT